MKLYDLLEDRIKTTLPDTEISSIKNKILPLGDSTKVYPGHGPESTIEFEKKMNPYLQ